MSVVAQISQRPCHTFDEIPSSPGADIAQPVGLVTRMQVQSPLIKFSFIASLVHPSQQDLVLIGDDFIIIKRIEDDCHARKIGSLSHPQLSTGIRAARILTLLPDIQYHASFGREIEAPQVIVLTLQSGDLGFVWGMVAQDGNIVCHLHSMPSPQPYDYIHQLGRHLALDPRGRLVATAAYDRNLCISRFPKSNLPDDPQNPESSSGRTFDKILHFNLEESISHVEFLYTALDNIAALIVILLNEEGCRVLFQEWDVWSALPLARSWQTFHFPLDFEKVMFIIPLNTPYSCLFVSQSDVMLCTEMNIEPKFTQISISGDMTALRPVSPLRNPIWTAWCRNVDRFAFESNKTDDMIYLGREDGLAARLLVNSSDQHLVTGSVIGDIGCPIGSTLSSFSPSWLPSDDHDILIVPPTTGLGLMIRTPREGGPSITVPHQAELFELLPGWCPIIDVTSVRGNRARRLVQPPRDSIPSSVIIPPNESQARIFAVCGRQPYGAIAELRFGLELRIGRIIQASLFRFSNKIWSFKNPNHGHHYLIVSHPQGSSLLHLDNTNVASLSYSFPDHYNPDILTVGAGQLGDYHAAQVTVDCVRIYFLEAEFPCQHIQPVDAGYQITSCGIHSASKTVAVSLRTGSTASICVYWYKVDGNGGGVSLAHIAHFSLESDQEVAAVSLEQFGDRLLLVCCLVNGGIRFFNPCRESHELSQVGAINLDANPGSFVSQNAVHSFCLLEPLLPDPIVTVKRAVLMASLRNGNLYVAFLSICLEGPSSLVVNVTCSTTSTFLLHPATVTKTSVESALIASGDTLLRACFTSYASDLDFQAVHATDINYPERQQPSFYPICGFSNIPNLQSEVDPYLGALACVSDGYLFIGRIDPHLKSIPRRVRVPGSPRRVLYSSYLKSLIVASHCVNDRPPTGRDPSSAAGVTPQGVLFAVSPDPPLRNPILRVDHGNTATVTMESLLLVDMSSDNQGYSREAPSAPALGFGPNESATLGSFSLWSNEQIFSIKEWVVTTEKGKQKCLVLVGTRYKGETGGSATNGGRLLILHARKNADGGIAFNLVKKVVHTSPVYAVDTFGNEGIIYTVGSQIKILALSLETKTVVPFETINSRSLPFSVTVKSPFAYVCTSNESTFVYQLPDLSNQVPPFVGAAECKLVYTDVSPRDSSTHFPIQLDPRRRYALVDDHPAVSSRMLLVADKSRGITGLWEPLPGSVRPQLAAELAFSAVLPRTVSTIIQCQTRQPWCPRSFFTSPGSELQEQEGMYPSPIPALGVIADGILGFAVDGTIVGMSVVDQNGWLFLKAVERVRRCSRQIRRLIQVADLNKDDPHHHVVTLVSEREQDVLDNLSMIDPRLDQEGMRSRTVYHINGDMLAELDSAEGMLAFIQALSFDTLEGSKQLSDYYAYIWGLFRERQGVDFHEYESEPSEAMLACLRATRPPLGTNIETLGSSQEPEERDAHLKSAQDAIRSRTSFLWHACAPFISPDELATRRGLERDGEVYMLAELVMQLLKPMIPNLYGRSFEAW